MDNINYIPQIDYTSRDYTSIREDLLALINRYTPAWTSRDPSDLGMTIVEMFSYMGDLLNFYIDRAANEGFLATASQRESILQIAAMLGYVPNMPSAATTTLHFSNSSAIDVTIPAGTQVATTTVVDGVNTQVIFETDSSLLVDAGAANVSVAATQGYTVSSESVGISDGTPTQAFKLAEAGVIGGTISITVASTPYTYVSNILDYGPADAVFTTVNDAYKNTYVVFGDGVNGKIPTNGSTVYATYRSGLGSDGNVIAGTLTNIINESLAGITVSNVDDAVGGADEESTDSIRINAPRALRALTRAVSLKDYASIALQVSGVAKAVADGTTYSNVILYLAPVGDPGVSAGVPTAAFTALSDKVALYFTDKIAPNVTLSILPPTYVPVNIEMTTHVLPQYQQVSVLSQVNAVINEMFTVDNSFFADVIPVQYVMNAASSVPGVDYVTVELLRRDSAEQEFTINAYSRTGYTVTVTTSATHNLTVGQKVRVHADVTATDGDWIVSAVTSTTVSYVTTTTGSISSTSISPTGTIRALVLETISCAVNEIPSLGTVTQTGTGGIQ